MQGSQPLTTEDVYNVVFDQPLDGIAGWLRPMERQCLYALALRSTTPVLELGCWVGLSTACLASGVRDSGFLEEMTAVDLNPTTHHFRDVGGGRVGMFLPPDSDTPIGVCTEESYVREMLPVLSHPGRALALLDGNLGRLGLRPYVRIVEGDFREIDLGETYGLIFADVTHSEREMNQNCPAIRSLARPGSALAFHDIRSPKEVELIESYFDFASSFRVDSLYVGYLAS